MKLLHARANPPGKEPFIVITIVVVFVVVAAAAAAIVPGIAGLDCPRIMHSPSFAVWYWHV